MGFVLNCIKVVGVKQTERYIRCQNKNERYSTGERDAYEEGR